VPDRTVEGAVVASTTGSARLELGIFSARSV
jgi:hypothetical protein